MTTITPLDEGRVCPGPQGGRWHDRIEVDGYAWSRGDEFYVFDHHGAPRPVAFMYHYTGNGTTVCYSKQRHRRPNERVSVPVGFVEMMPNRRAMSMSRIEMAVRQTIADLIDIGLKADADALLQAFEDALDDAEITEALDVAKVALELADDAA